PRGLWGEDPRGHGIQDHPWGTRWGPGDHQGLCGVCSPFLRWHKLDAPPRLRRSSGWYLFRNRAAFGNPYVASRRLTQHSRVQSTPGAMTVTKKWFLGSKRTVISPGEALRAYADSELRSIQARSMGYYGPRKEFTIYF